MDSGDCSCIRGAFNLDEDVDLETDRNPEPSSSEIHNNDDDDEPQAHDESSAVNTQQVTELLVATVQEQLLPDVPTVAHSKHQATVGRLLEGKIEPPNGQNVYIIPGFQRNYSWDAELAAALPRDILSLYNSGLQQHTLGDILLYKHEAHSTENHVLNGQQRMVTLFILLSLLRHIAQRKEYKDCLRIIDEIKPFKFPLDHGGKEEVRLKLRPNQQPYFNSWFLTDPSPLWKDFFDLDPNAGVNLQLAEVDGSRDVVLERLLRAADAIRRVLLTAPRSRDAASGDYMCDDEDRLRGFIVYLRDNIKIGVGVCSGGGQHYCTWVFHQSNYSQLTLTDLDMIKTNLISSRMIPSDEGEHLASLWEQHEQLLGSHVIQCLHGRNAFRHCFYIARELVVRDYVASPLSHVFSTCQGQKILHLGENPVKFVNDYLKPTLQAMDLIFNWDKSITAAAGASKEIRWLLDRVKTHITALLQMTTFTNREKSYRPSMAFWLTIAVPLFANLYDPSNAEKLKPLVMMLRKLEVFTLYTALQGVHWGAIRCILITGGETKLRSEKGKVKGVLKLLTSEGTQGIIYNTTSPEGALAFARCLNLAQQSLTLTDHQQQQMAIKLLNFQTDKRQLGKKLANIFIRFHNDSLRGEDAENFIPAEAQDPTLQMSKDKEIKVAVEHILPQGRLTKDFKSDGWTEQEYKQWKGKPGNLVWQPSFRSEDVSNYDYQTKLLVYDQCGTEILTFAELPGLAWTPEDCKKRDRDVLLAVAHRIGISENLMESTAARMDINGKVIQDEPAASGDCSYTPRWPPKSPADVAAADGAVAATVPIAPAAAGAGAGAGASRGRRSKAVANAGRGPSGSQQARKKGRRNDST